MAKRMTEEIPDDIPIDEEDVQEEDSGIPTYVPEADLDRPDKEDAEKTRARMPKGTKSKAKKTKTAQPTQTKTTPSTAPEPPFKAASAPGSKDTPKGKNAAPAAQDEVPAPSEPPTTPALGVPAHPTVPPAVIAAVAPHPGVSTQVEDPPGNPVEIPLGKPDENTVCVQPVDPAVGPPDHGDLVNQTEMPQLAPPPPPRPPPRLLRPGEKVDTPTARKWDEMMAEVSQATRLTIWEMGLDGMQKLLTTPKNDLLKPRGRLVPPQLKEVEDWLVKELNFKLPKSRQETLRAYVPPAPIKVSGSGIATRKMTSELAAQRRARLKSLRGDSTRK